METENVNADCCIAPNFVIPASEPESVNVDFNPKAGLLRTKVLAMTKIKTKKFLLAS